MKVGLYTKFQTLGSSLGVANYKVGVTFMECGETAMYDPNSKQSE